MLYDRLIKENTMEEKKVKHHWNYFLNLERDLDKITNYIEATVDNYKTYSFEINKVIQLASSEFEAVSKYLCSLINNNNFEDADINKLRNVICEKYPLIYTTKIKIPRMNEEILPLEEWGDKKNTPWWSDHNSTKHNRYKYYRLSTFQNAIYSLASLLVINMYLNKLVNVAVDRLPLLLEADYLPQAALAPGQLKLPDFGED